MTTFQALTLMISFTTMIIALIAVVVAILNAKNSPPVRQNG
ncbi:putative holin-like toxin [Gracilibacillus boraciitolerans]|nr:putative holin-like toxin [Gracilibacillus boraciitolerans]